MKRAIIYILAGIIYVVMLYNIPNVYRISTFALSVILLILYSIVIFLIEWYHSFERHEHYADVESIEYAILCKMQAEGYQCEKEEGVMVYQLNGRKYMTGFWNSGNGCYRAAIVDYLTIDDDWDDISNEGKAVLANHVNMECPHSLFVSHERGVACRFYTDVRNPDDFIRAAQDGYHVIGEAVETAMKALPQIKMQYSNKTNANPIGFVNRENGNCPK